MNLPSDLQEFISKEIGWQYNRLKEDYARTDDIDIENYIGTYFPRSFAEYYNISGLLFENKIIEKSLMNLKEIWILDIGSGTGGNILGLLWKFKEQILIQKKRNFGIYLISIDSNNKALSIQGKLINKFFGDFVAFQCYQLDFSSRNNLSVYLKKLLKEQNQSYDIVMSSKFVKEFYTNEAEYERNKGLYGELFKIVSAHLRLEGFFILSDVTIKLYNNSCHWTPQIFNKETIEILKDKNVDLVPIHPLPCAFWHNICRNPEFCYPQKKFYVQYYINNELKNEETKITYKIFAKKKFAEKILPKNNCSGYIICEKEGKYNTCKIISKGIAESRSSDQGCNLQSFQDAYGWDTNEKFILKSEISYTNDIPF